MKRSHLAVLLLAVALLNAAVVFLSLSWWREGAAAGLVGIAILIMWAAVAIVDRIESTPVAVDYDELGRRQ